MLATIVKNGKYHLATFKVENNITICDFNRCQITMKDPDPSNALFMIEYVHGLTFIESDVVRKKFPCTKHFSLPQLIEFLNNQEEDPFPSLITYYN